MAFSKDHSTDLDLQTRLLATLTGEAHELNPRYYQLFDDAYKRLTQYPPNLTTESALKWMEHSNLQDHPSLVNTRETVRKQWDEAHAGSEDEVLAQKAFEAANQAARVHITGGNSSVVWTHPMFSPQVPTATDSGSLDAILSRWKGSSTDTATQPLHFIVHRLRNLPLYEAASPEQRDQLDREWLQAQQKRTNSSDGAVSFPKIRRALVEHPDLVSETLRNQRDFHNALIHVNAHNLVPMPDGNYGIRVARGLYNEKHGPDATLAAYSAGHDSGFGTHQHKYIVPLDHVWHSFDMRMPSDAGGMSTESELIVDNAHGRIPADKPKWGTSVPREYLSYDTTPFEMMDKKQVKRLLEDQFFATQSYTSHAGHIHGVPDWLDKVNPMDVVHHVVKSGFAPVYATPANRDKLAEKLKLPSDAHWEMLGNVGNDILVHKFGKTPMAVTSQSALTSPALLDWMVHRYPSPLSPEQQQAVMKNAHVTTKLAMAHRPEIDPVMKAGILHEHADANVQSPWEWHKESLYSPRNL